MTTRSQKTTEPWSNLSNGKRSAITLMWNRFRNIAEIEKRTALDPKVITAYLASRPGYPGTVLKATNNKRQPKVSLRERGLYQPNTPQAKPITLPRVRILEKQFDWLDR